MKDKMKENYTFCYKVNRSDELLNFLLGKMPLSRNAIKSLLTDHKVLVNGAMVTKFNYPLAKDDEVKISRFPIKAEPLKTRKKADIDIKRLIIYEDEQFLAINKPHGLLSVQSDKERECAYGYATAYLQKKNPKGRLYILHRIDKETSGVLVFAKDIVIHSKLKGHWNDDIAMREYYAVVEGRMENKSGTITSYLKENRNNMVYVAKGKDGKKAITHYEVVKENDKYSLLRVCIDSGRKNQIRVQMASLGHPIVGDDKYGTGLGPLKRLGLHASRLDFIHPETKESLSLVAKVPQSFYALFK